MCKIVFLNGEIIDNGFASLPQRVNVSISKFALTQE
jgi:hypothetical protein